jgi:glycosyltransferase involved in cell wall biosynthesis
MSSVRPTKHPFSLSMLGWALNEEQNIAGYIERAGRFLAALTDDYELIIIDDGSTDGTLAVARAYAESRPWLKIYANERNRGSGYNSKRAVGLATKDYLFWQTTDWAYDITRLGENLGYLADYDVLQGVRLNTISLHGLLRRSDNGLKALISITNYLLVRLLFRLPLHDYQNVTVYPRRLIQSVTLESESAFTNPECLLKVWWKGARIKEIPVPFLKRQLGLAKGTRPKVIWASIRDIFGWWWRWIVRGRRRDHGRGTVHAWSEADDLAGATTIQRAGSETSDRSRAAA